MNFDAVKNSFFQRFLFPQRDDIKDCLDNAIDEIELIDRNKEGDLVKFLYKLPTNKLNEIFATCLSSKERRTIVKSHNISLIEQTVKYSFLINYDSVKNALFHLAGKSPIIEKIADYIIGKSNQNTEMKTEVGLNGFEVNELTKQILDHLSPYQKMALMRVCRTWTLLTEEEYRLHKLRDTKIKFLITSNKAITISLLFLGQNPYQRGLGQGRWKIIEDSDEENKDISEGPFDYSFNKADNKEINIKLKNGTYCVYKENLSPQSPHIRFLSKTDKKICYEKDYCVYIKTKEVEYPNNYFDLENEENNLFECGGYFYEKLPFSGRDSQFSFNGRDIQTIEIRNLFWVDGKIQIMKNSIDFALNPDIVEDSAFLGTKSIELLNS